MSSQYIEQGITDDTSDAHRALASLQEELEAIDYYGQRADRASDPELKKVFLHNRLEEIEHASMLFEWLRRKHPDFAEKMKTYLFTSGDITAVEAATKGVGGPAADCSLGLGKSV